MATLIQNMPVAASSGLNAVTLMSQGVAQRVWMPTMPP